MENTEELHRACANLANCTQAVELAERTLIAAGIDSPRFEAQLLTALAFQVDRVAIIARTAPVPDSGRKADLFRLLEARARRVPLAYLRGDREFYGLTFAVTPATLIPRPETELLVDFAIEIMGRASAAERPPLMIDVGSGSGCIAISALKHCPGARALAIDISSEAIAVAKKNSVSIGVSDRIRFVHSNLLEGIRERAQLIVSNPPYIASGKIENLQPEVADYEPRVALDGGEDGLDLIREIVSSASAALEPGGWLAIECAQGQSSPVFDLFNSAGLDAIRTINDLAGIERIVCGMRPFAER